MRNRRDYKKATQVKLDSLDIKLVGVKNESNNSDIVSSEVIDLVAKLFQLANKRGPVKLDSVEVFNEAV